MEFMMLVSRNWCGELWKGTTEPSLRMDRRPRVKHTPCEVTPMKLELFLWQLQIYSRRYPQYLETPCCTNDSTAIEILL
jgi:hypothetical protein